MNETRATAFFRALFRWYLARFPLRDGKALFYQRLHQRLTPGERDATVRMSHGFAMKLDLCDPEQLKLYFYRHYHERYEADLVARLLDRDEVFWDVGANVGYFTLVAATALHHSGQIVALEPGKNAFAHLSENISLNPYDNIRIYRLAASNQAGEAVLYLSPDLADSSANLYQPGQDQSDYEICQTVSLDEFFHGQGLSPPQLIKVDVEGSEMVVLKGAKEIISRFRPLWIVEMEEKNLAAAGSSRAEIQEFLEGYSYRAAFLRKGRWYETEDVSEVKGRNIFWFNPTVSQHRYKAGRVFTRR